MRTATGTRGARVAVTVALLVLGVVGVIVERTAVLLRDAIAHVEHTYDVIARLERLENALGDVENARRAYSLTLDSAPLADFDEASTRIRRLSGELHSLTADNPEQQKRLTELDAELETRLSALASAIKERAREFDAAKEAAATREGATLGAHARETITVMVRSEERLLAERREHADRAVGWLRTVQIGGTASALVLLGWAFARTRRETLVRARSEAALATTLNSIADAVIALDSAGRITRMNAVAEKLTGWKRDEAVGQTADSVIRVREDESEDEGETGGPVLVSKGGDETPIVQNEAPIAVGEDAPSGKVVVFRDVSKERATAAERRRLTAFLDSIVENIPHMVFVKEAEKLRFELLNRAGEELLGLSRADLLGKSDADFFPEEQAKAFVQADRDVLASGVVKDIAEEPIDTKRGRVWLHTKKVPVLDASGRPRYLLGISEDVTERKKALEEIAAARDALATANRELEAFSYSVAHDLRAPLRAIDGFSQALRDDYQDKLDANGKDYLRRISAAARRMGDLIDALLDLARLARAETAIQRIDLSALARGIAAELSARYPQTQIEIASGLEARGDLGLVRVAVQNLLDNAFKFSSKKDDARVEVGEIDGAFFVRDNGAGFDAGAAKSLFGAFQRFHKASEFSGTGIGLATVQRVVRRHGGRVWVESEPGKGTSFFFTLTPETR